MGRLRDFPFRTKPPWVPSQAPANPGSSPVSSGLCSERPELCKLRPKDASLPMEPGTLPCLASRLHTKGLHKSLTQYTYRVDGFSPRQTLSVGRRSLRWSYHSLSTMHNRTANRSARDPLPNAISYSDNPRPSPHSFRSRHKPRSPQVTLPTGHGGSLVGQKLYSSTAITPADAPEYRLLC